MPDNVFLAFTEPLARAHFRYAVTGSVAGIAYGEPRMTNDIDIVIDVAVADVPLLAACFPLSDFYFPPEEVVVVELRREQRGHFNIIHHDSGFKADMYPKGTDPVQQWAVDGARIVEVDGAAIALAPPEYVIVKKLEFFREGGSQKHLHDIAAILRARAALLDTALIASHVRRLGLETQWDAAQNA